MKTIVVTLCCLLTVWARAQLVEDSGRVNTIDTSLRITNLSPFFTVHVDSVLSYQFLVNKSSSRYHWYLQNHPPGLQINKDNGSLHFKADKSYFISGRLQYDYPYRVKIEVQDLSNTTERFDTGFVILFFNTEIVPSKVKPSVSDQLTVEEGELVSFIIQCENGDYPFEHIVFSSSQPIDSFSLVKQCNDIFSWRPGYDLVKETDEGKEKMIHLYFIGISKYNLRDTALVSIRVKDALNYPLAVQQHELAKKNIENYVLQLKYAFLQMDRQIKKSRSIRTSFDLGTAASSLSGTILSASESQGSQRTGRILPGIGLSLVPIKEATAPTKTVEQNQAALIRSSIKRLEYILNENMLVGDKDPAVAGKTNLLKTELKQIQVQLLDVPLELTPMHSAEELNRYFTSRKVNKKYRLKR